MVKGVNLSNFQRRQSVDVAEKHLCVFSIGTQACFLPNTSLPFSWRPVSATDVLRSSRRIGRSGTPVLVCDSLRKVSTGARMSQANVPVNGEPR